MRYLITFSYDGTDFHGFQRQKGKRTIQGAIEGVLSELNNDKVEIHAAGRTDAGVHALAQRAHFDMREVKLYNLKKFLNSRLNKEIYIKEIEIVPDTFHARYNVQEKIYKYFLNTGEFDPTKRKYIYQFCKKLNTNKIKEVIPLFLGTHDFRSFCTGEKENCIRTIKRIDLEKKDSILTFTFMGDGFLRKMIRSIVGILIEVGLEKKTKEDVQKIIESKEKKHNTKPADACGLYLVEINYKKT